MPAFLSVVPRYCLSGQQRENNRAFPLRAQTSNVIGQSQTGHSCLYGTAAIVRTAGWLVERLPSPAMGCPHLQVSGMASTVRLVILHPAGVAWGIFSLILCFSDHIPDSGISTAPSTNK